MRVLMEGGGGSGIHLSCKQQNKQKSTHTHINYSLTNLFFGGGGGIFGLVFTFKLVIQYSFFLLFIQII